jgi:PPOX class probable F420-dependent enzyme
MGLLVGARRGVLATLDRVGAPHCVPVCFARRGAEIVTAVDQKPKRGGELSRIANIRRRPDATLLVDRWDEDWSRLAWVMVRATARLDLPGSAERQLLERYPQYRTDPPRGDVIALEPQRVFWWLGG